jgi:hypothetical protein
LIWKYFKIYQKRATFALEEAKMPIQDFFLDSTGAQRIQVHWNSDGSKASLLLNSSIYGSLDTPEELAGGKDFKMPDGSILHVRLVNNQPQVLRNGFPLTTAPAAVESVPLTDRKLGGCLTVWIILNLAMISLSTLLYGLAFLGSAITGDSSVSPLVFLVFTLLGFAGIAGLILLLFWRKIGFYLVLLYVLLNFALSFPLGLFNKDPRIFLPLIGGAILYYWLRRNDVWEKLA